ncbi:peptidoglycan-binding protein [Streptomyces albogriseolus]|uniref:peptidoglycan-binding protein n=1 Tax=Streptomyces TaxID=1883 RepID=UPI002A763EA6|nr:peptidoglycan-binding protein [Streptomyces sp. CL7]WPP30088.1 peptidoglycan-binding protein [Streptomyces sp. CL7]
MGSPVCEEFGPAGDRACPGCAGDHRERPLPRAGRPRRSPAHLAALVVAAVTSAALGAHPVPAGAAQDARVSTGQGVPADQRSGGGQGAPGPLFGSDGRTGPALPPGAPGTIPAISRTDIVERAASWVSQKVPYNVSSYWSDGYRQDCSGYVSMAWKLPGNEWTGSLAQYADKITKAELQPGDILLFHNASDPYNGSHVVIFGGWANSARTQYVAYEQTPPHTRKMTTPYAYWNNSASYVPYRYKGVTDGAAGAAPEAVAAARPALPAEPVADSPPVAEGADAAGPGGGELVPAVPDGPRGTDAGEGAAGGAPARRGVAVDGAAGPRAGRSGGAPDVSNGGSASAPAGLLAAPASHGAPGSPDRARFRPGTENEHVTRLGRQPAATGSGRHRTQGPGPRRGEEDRRDAADFQRAQGRSGRVADGVPGPETWRRLFS